MLAGDVFVDPPQTLAPGTEISVAGLPQGRYAQYRLDLASRDPSSASPALSAVALRGVYVE